MEEYGKEIGNVSWVLLAVLLFVLSPLVLGDERQDTPADVIEINGDVKFNCIPVKFNPGMVICTFQIDIKDIGKTFEVVPKAMSGASNGKSW